MTRNFEGPQCQMVRPQPMTGRAQHPPRHPAPPPFLTAQGLVVQQNGPLNQLSHTGGLKSDLWIGGMLSTFGTGRQ